MNKYNQQLYKSIFVNVLTLLRIVGIPFIFMITNRIFLFVYVVFLFLTDFFDGYLSRKWNCSSQLGAILDLVADKLLVIILFIACGARHVISYWFVFLVVFREIASMIIREINLRTKNKLIKASLLGKSKTALQFISIGMMMLEIPGYKLVLLIMIVISYISFFSYVRQFLAKESDHD